MGYELLSRHYVTQAGHMLTYEAELTVPEVLRNCQVAFTWCHVIGLTKKVEIHQNM